MLDKKQPIVIKKGGHGGHGHHGGAWKVAFADFAVAMMAFFMLMWLLGSTGQEQRAGISDYFQNPSGVQGPGGASTSMIKLGGSQDMTPGDTAQHKSGDEHDKDTARTETAEKKIEVEKEVEKELEKQRLDGLMSDLKEAMERSQSLQLFKDQLLLDITPDGLRIQIVDKKNRPMFDAGSAHIKHYTAEMLFELAKFIDKLPNRISITGHTDASRSKREDYSNWELSADRANTARRALIDGGLSAHKIGRVIGLADSILFDKEDPYNPVNRRISIIVMNKEADEAINRKEAPPAYDPTEKNNEDLDARPRGFKLTELPESAQQPVAASTSEHGGAAVTPSADQHRAAESAHAKDGSRPHAPTVGGIDFSAGTRIKLPPLPGQGGANAPAPKGDAADSTAADQAPPDAADEELPPLGIDFF